jgi:hypothetical protein
MNLNVKNVRETLHFSSPLLNMGRKNHSLAHIVKAEV